MRYSYKILFILPLFCLISHEIYAAKLKNNKHIFYKFSAIDITEKISNSSTTSSSVAPLGLGFAHFFYKKKRNLFSYVLSASLFSDSNGYDMGREYFAKVLYHRRLKKRLNGKLGPFYKSTPFISNASTALKTERFNLAGLELGMTYNARMKGQSIPINLNLLYPFFSNQEYLVLGTKEKLKGYIFKLATNIKFNPKWSWNFAAEYFLLNAGEQVDLSGLGLNSGIGYYF